MTDSPVTETDVETSADADVLAGGTPQTEVSAAAEASLDAVQDEAAPSVDSDAESDDSGDSDDDSDDDSADDDEDGEGEGKENPLEVEGEIAADYLEELLDIADLDGDIDTYIESGRAHVSIITEGDQLVGADGEVLDALQELARLAVMTETGHRSRLMLDVAGYRDRRRTTLVELAADAVSEVKSSGESVRLQPMNPFERKIVHDAVAEAGLTSESEGEEPSRRVVVLPATA